VPIVLKSGSLNLLELSGLVQACNGIALPLLLVLVAAAAAAAVVVVVVVVVILIISLCQSRSHTHYALCYKCIFYGHSLLSYQIRWLRLRVP